MYFYTHDFGVSAIAYNCSQRGRSDVFLTQLEIYVSVFHPHTVALQVLSCLGDFGLETVVFFMFKKLNSAEF